MSGMTTLALAVLLGGACAAGILLILRAVPQWGMRPLTVRLAPYVRGAVPDDVLPRGTVATAGVLPARARSLWTRSTELLSRVLGGDETIALRLTQAGRSETVAMFRGQQLLAALTGLAFGSVVVILLVLGGRLSAPAVILPLIGAAAGAILWDSLLSSRARARVTRLGEEIPTTLEFLGLCLAAGEGLFDSIRRVAAVGSGELTGEFQRVVVEVDTGEPLASALQAMAARLNAPQISRAVDQIIAALDRGAPLAAVLQSQAHDAREDAKRQLIEQAGRKEITMMLPLVFLILPLSVLFAVFPGVVMFQIGLN